MANQGGRHSRSKQVALSGVLSALAIVLMLLGGLIPIGTYMAPMLAGLCLLPIVEELGPKWALLAFAAVGLLSFLLVPDRELTLFFLFLFGYYPILQPALLRMRSKVLAWVLRLLLFNAAAVGVYALLLTVLVTPAFRAEFAQQAPWFWAALLAAGNLLFVLYDNMLCKVRLVYIKRFRKIVFK